MQLTGAHLHLLVNHAPLFGALFALALSAASFFYAPDVLRRVALVALLCAGVAGWVADLTGDPAEDAIRGFPGVKREVIHAHEAMAGKSFIVAGVIGLVALGTLVRTRRSPLGSRAGGLTLVGAALVSGMMAYTALLGGQVRHTEVRPDASAADAAAVEPPRQRPPTAPPSP